MYEPDGNEMLVVARDPEDKEFRISIDDETYARLVNEGWTLTGQFATVRPPVTEEMFQRAVQSST